jgi:cytochrome P450
MQEITLKVIIKLVFGIDTENQRYRELQQILTSLLDAIGSPLSSSLIFFQSLQKDWGKFSPWGRYLRLRQRLKELLDTEIQLRRTNPQLLGKDILSLLITTTDTAGNNLSDREIQDELMTLFVAGHETTASALVWELYWVHYLPNVKNKLLQELSQLDQNSNLNQILKLPYLDGIVAETLRIYPVVPGIFTRKLKSNLKVLDYEFMTGTSFVISIHGTHRREDIYPQAKEFKPERFLEKQYPPHEYFPFGGGSRRCIGSALAQMEMKLVLITMLSRYQLKLTSDRPIKPVRRGLTFAAPNNFKMVVVQDLHNSRN